MGNAITLAVSAAVLAGGQSRRMGRDKAFVPVGGRPVIERVIERVAPLSDDVLLIATTPRSIRPSSRPVGGRHLSRQGSLGGIYTALQAARYDRCLVVACDMAFLTPILLRYLIDLSPDYDVVIPRVEEFPRNAARRLRQALPGADPAPAAGRPSSRSSASSTRCACVT